MTFCLGLTGSIGMGKSTTAQMFRDAGIPVWDADATVHKLYAEGGAAVAPMRLAFPEVVRGNLVSRDALKECIQSDPSVLKQVEAIVHPLVAADRDAFRKSQTGPIALFDIPLLFETGADRWLDGVVVVTAPPDVQRARVLARPGMSEAQFQTILSRQTPDAEKRARADFVIETTTIDAARARVTEIIQQIAARG